MQLNQSASFKIVKQYPLSKNSTKLFNGTLKDNSPYEGRVELTEKNRTVSIKNGKINAIDPIEKK